MKRNNYERVVWALVSVGCGATPALPGPTPTDAMTTPDAMVAPDVTTQDDGAGADPCSRADTCATCTPMAGCGWCSATRRCVAVNATCRGPSSGSCGSGWACQSADCEGSTDCRACATDADCVSGMCRARACDGARACVPLGREPLCATIGGTLACPAVHAYRRCTTHEQCGDRMDCLPVWPGQTDRVCVLPCTDNSQCPAAPADGGAVAFCGTTDRYCHLGCSRAGSCGGGLACQRDLTGAYAFCL